jgi:hypothetical protein
MLRVWAASVEFDKRLYRHDIMLYRPRHHAGAKVAVLTDAERDSIVVMACKSR